MDPDKPSMTALGVAYIRAYHYERHETPVFEDAVAGALITPEEREFFNGLGLSALSSNHPELVSADPQQTLDSAFAAYPATSGVIARSRISEDLLQQAIDRGLDQYVVIGAGMDTFGIRRPDLRERLNVFEIDYPTTQAFKRERMAEAGFDVPSNLHFVPADFEFDTVASALARTPFEGDRETFFAWHGVTPYLSRSAIASTLSSVRSIAVPGSEIVFDYFDQAYFDPATQPQEVRDMFELVASFGEPFVSGFDPTTLDEELASSGFALVEDAGPDELNRRFFTGRSDGLKTPGITHIAHARVI